jgi:hypothetical protein
MLLIQTYYVVAQMGLISDFFLRRYFATDYMLGIISFVLCLLYVYAVYLLKIGVCRRISLSYSQNNNNSIEESMGMQLAENCKGFSETARQLPDDGLNKF